MQPRRFKGVEICQASEPGAGGGGISSMTESDPKAMGDSDEGEWEDACLERQEQ